MFLYVKLKLPPEGYFVRDLTLSFIVLTMQLGDQVHIGYDYMDDSFEIKFEKTRTIYDVLNIAKDILEDKIASKLRSPMMNINDINYVLKRIVGVKAKLTYNDLMVKVLEKAISQRNLNLEELKVVSETRSPSAVSVVLGNREVTAIQPFKIESYEKALALNKPYSLKYEMRLSKTWYTILAAGYALAYSGFTGGEMVFISPTLTTLIKTLEHDIPYNILPSILTTATSLNVVPEPKIAYLLYLALVLSESYRYVQTLGFFNIVLTRIALAQNVYTLYERTEANLEPLMSFISKVRNECSKDLKYALRRTLNPRTYDSKLATFATLLYEGIFKSKPPYETVYYGVREEIKVNSETRRIISSKECAKKLWDELQ